MTTIKMQKGAPAGPAQWLRQALFKDVDAKLDELERKVRSKLSVSAKKHLDRTKLLRTTKRALNALASKR
jgi:hypothetical protein